MKVHTTDACFCKRNEDCTFYFPRFHDNECCIVGMDQYDSDVVINFPFTHKDGVIDWECTRVLTFSSRRVER